jgi:hypothetical protein
MRTATAALQQSTKDTTLDDIEEERRGRRTVTPRQVQTREILKLRILRRKNIR